MKKIRFHKKVTAGNYLWMKKKYQHRFLSNLIHITEDGTVYMADFVCKCTGRCMGATYFFACTVRLDFLKVTLEQIVRNVFSM